MAETYRLAANPYRRVALQLSDHDDWIPVITEGDSWFSFPGIAWRMNVIGHLQQTFQGRMAMLLMSYNGDHATDILADKQKRKLRYALKHRFGFRILLFSAGGNDVVDRIPSVLRQKEAGMNWKDCIDETRLEEVIEEVRGAYVTLLGLRDRHNAGCHVFAHCYDYPTVNGKAATILGKKISGPWLQPPMIERGIEDSADQQNIVRHALSRFKTMLNELPGITPNPLSIVDTAGTLQPRHWKDEIHPSTEGFGLIAQRFGQEIIRHFPQALSQSALDNYNP